MVCDRHLFANDQCRLVKEQLLAMDKLELLNGSKCIELGIQNQFRLPLQYIT